MSDLDKDRLRKEYDEIITEARENGWGFVTLILASQAESNKSTMMMVAEDPENESTLGLMSVVASVIGSTMNADDPVVYGSDYDMSPVDFIRSATLPKINENDGGEHE